MIIYKHNLAEKLFGFAYSKEFLRENTDLCGFVDDANLALDIDLAVEFHKALRSDPIAAEKVTNLLILSSSYIDPSTAEFYTDKMKTYPVFDKHIDRINDIFVSLPNIPTVNPNNLPDDERERELIGRYINEELKKIEKDRTVTTTVTTKPSLTGATVIISDNTPTTPDTIFTKVTPISSEGLPYEKPEKVLYERVSIATGYSITQLQDIAFNSNFGSALSNALSDCLNSPCNLFSETSDSIASLANTHSMMNSTTMPTWGELKNNFFNALGGVPDTVFKKVPMSIKNSIIELGQIGQKAVEQSTELFFAFKEEDKAKKQKIIDKAKSGQSLNTDSEGYKYLPDLDSYLNLSKISSNILTKAAEDLGGCFSKFEQAHRYEPYNPEHNKSITSKEPTNNKVGDDQVKQNTLSKTNNDYNYRKDSSMSSRCDYSEPGSAEGSGTKTSTGGSLGRGKTSKASDDPEVQRELRALAAKLGVSVEALEAVIQLESGWSTTAGTGSYRGLAQMNAASFGNRTDLWEKYINGSAADQVSAWGEYLQSSTNLTAVRNSVNLISYSPAEQAAVLQATQFAPMGSNTGVSWSKEFINGNTNVRTTRTNQPQARALGDTSISDMTKYYSGN